MRTRGKNILSRLISNENISNDDIRMSSNVSGGSLGDSIEFYFLYVHPVVLLLLVIWNVILFRLLRGEGFLHKYGKLFAFTISDIVGLLIEASSYIAFKVWFPLSIPGHVCLPYDILSIAAPLFMSTMSQWLKIGHILFVCLLITKPLKVKLLMRRRNVCVYVLLSVTISCLVTVPLTYTEHAQKVFTVGRDNLTSHFCGHKDFVKRTFLSEFQSDLLTTFLIVSQSCRWLVPLPLFLILTVRTALAIRKSIATKRKLVADQTLVTGTVKIAKTTVAVAIFYTIVTLVAIPSISWDIIRRFPINNNDIRSFMAVMSVVSKLLYICNIPFTLLMFTLLSPRVKQLFRCFCGG